VGTLPVMTSRAELSDRVTPGCPKRMQFGPCGGVRPDGRCEMDSAPCVFDDVITWRG
jgi:methylenetetrahydrofolate reductase (NADPH)